MGVDIYFQCLDHEGEYGDPSEETITTIAEMVYGERIDYRAWQKLYQTWRENNDDASFDAAIMTGAGWLLSDLHNHCFPRRRRAVALLSDLTGQPFDEGQTDDPLVIRAVTEAIFGEVGIRVAPLVNKLYWA